MTTQAIYELAEDAVRYSFSLQFAKAFSTEEVPEEFSALNLLPGKYVYGYGTVEGETDEQGDEVTALAIVEGTKDLDKPPYNKVFISHDYKKIAAGKILFRKVVDTGEGKKLLLLAKLNEHLNSFHETWNSIKEGYLDSFSVGGSYGKVQRVFDEAKGRYVNKVITFKVREVSLTSYPALGKATILGTFEKTRKLIQELEENTVKEDKTLKKNAEATSEGAPVTKEGDSTMEQLQEVVSQISGRLEAVESALAELATQENTAKEADGKEEEEVEKDASPEGAAAPITLDEVRKAMREEMAKALAEPEKRLAKSAGASEDADKAEKQLKKTAENNKENQPQKTPLMDMIRGASA